MIIGKKDFIRTNVENLLLREMVDEDERYIILGENDDCALDDMSNEKDDSLFEDDDHDDYDDDEDDDDDD